MKAFNIFPKLPYSEKELPLMVDEYIRKPAYIKVRSNKIITIEDFIKDWSQQEGAAHEAWELKTDYKIFKDSNYNIPFLGSDMNSITLEIIALTILNYTRIFIKQLDA